MKLFPKFRGVPSTSEDIRTFFRAFSAFVGLYFNHPSGDQKLYALRFQLHEEYKQDIYLFVRQFLSLLFFREFPEIQQQYITGTKKNAVPVDLRTALEPFFFSLENEQPPFFWGW